MRILHGGRPSRQLTNLAGLFRAVGLDVDTVDVAGRPMTRDSLAGLAESGLVFDITSLSGIAGAAESLRQCIEAGGARAILLFVTDSAESTSSFLSEVTDGLVEGTRPASGESCCFTTPGLPAEHELAGACFERASRPALQLLGNGVEPIMCIGNEAAFARVRGAAASKLFVWSCLDVFDVTRRLSSELEFERGVDEFVPGIVFARAAAGQATWHNPAATASLVIDDPLLQPCYGHLDFRQLLASARDHGYTVALAFIPWNHWRTKRRHVAFFEHYGDVFSICVHGNDHTAAEFESGNRESLRYRANQAIERMDMHRDRTGLNYVPVMVCPQERYSVEALRGIAASGHYLAVVNSRMIPNVSEAGDCVTGADLLQPAMDAWSHSALLKRHYSAEGRDKFALELFLGRPAILAEHHEYFAAGTHRIEEFARELRGLRPDLSWRSPGEIARTLRWQRQVGANTWQVRFFTDEYHLQPVAEGTVSYQMERRVLDGSAVTGVSVDGRELDFTQDKNYVRFEIQTSGPVVVRVRRRASDTSFVPVAGLGNSTKVALRRLFSELRDRVITRGMPSTILMRLLGRTVRRQP